MPVSASKVVVNPDSIKTEVLGTEKSNREKQEKERLRLAELRRRQEEQCNFPDDYSNVPTVTGPAFTDGADLNGGEDRDHVSPTTRQPQHNNNNNNLRILPRVNYRRAEDDDEAGNPSIPTPVFERLVTDEVRELQIYVRMVENLNTELDKMRRYQKDLEKRLQDESVLHEQLEDTLEAREREWHDRFDDLEVEIKRLNGIVKAEENKNKVLLDHVRKKDQDIQKMLMKKYDHDVPNQRSAVRGIRTNQTPDPPKEKLPPKGTGAQQETREMHRSPDDYLRLLGSTEKIRERNTRNLLMDFFGM